MFYDSVSSFWFAVFVLGQLHETLPNSHLQYIGLYHAH